MEKNNQTTEYLDEEMIATLQSVASSVRPSEQSLRAMLAKLPARKAVKSPYAPKLSAFSGFQKFALIALSLVVLVGGGTLYTYKNFSGTPTATSPVAFAPSDSTTPTAKMMSLTGAMPMAAQEGSGISSDNSDEALASDIDTVSRQMALFDSDTASANQDTL